MVDVCSKFDKDTWNVTASFRINKELDTHAELAPQKHVELLIRPKISLMAAPFKIPRSACTVTEICQSWFVRIETKLVWTCKIQDFNLYHVQFSWQLSVFCNAFFPSEYYHNSNFTEFWQSLILIKCLTMLKLALLCWKNPDYYYWRTLGRKYQFQEN